MSKVGFIGLGIMGEGMAKNLAKSGRSLVVWNRSPAKCEALKQACEGAEITVVETPAAVLGACDLVYCMLSTPEAELAAAFYALRMFGIPALTFWETVLDRENLVLTFHEDNQTMIRVMKTGRNFAMRYATRTLRLPIAWMHERFKAGDIDLRYELSSRMAADIYTKAFTDSDKWLAATWLINIVDPAVLDQAAEFLLVEPEPQEPQPEEEDEEKKHEDEEDEEQLRRNPNKTNLKGGE